MGIQFPASFVTIAGSNSLGRTLAGVQQTVNNKGGDYAPITKCSSEVSDVSLLLTPGFYYSKFISLYVAYINVSYFADIY
jgi:hypothetical protein